MIANSALPFRRGPVGWRATHRGKLCSCCKISRARMMPGRCRSSQVFAWMRGGFFRMYSRNVDTPKYWAS